MNQININAIFVRAAKTFLQAFLAVVLAGLATTTDIIAAKALLIAAFAAGVSALMNLFFRPQESK